MICDRVVAVQQKSVVSVYCKLTTERSNGLMVIVYIYYQNISTLSHGFNSGCGHFFIILDKS